jgi:hypothetical protein
MERYLRRIGLGALAACLLSATTFAQTVGDPVARADVAGTVAWLNTNRPDRSGQQYNNWNNHGLYGAATGGWYWTDHHKTEVEFGVSNRIRFQDYESTVVDGLNTYSLSRQTISSRRVSISEHYQFFRNALFHPHVGAGVDLAWVETTRNADPIFVYDSVGRVSRQVRPAVVTGPDTALQARLFGEVGFKAYMTPRSFFRSDLRLGGRQHLDEVLFRFGFGVDF